MSGFHEGMARCFDGRDRGRAHRPPCFVPQGPPVAVLVIEDAEVEVSKNVIGRAWDRDEAVQIELLGALSGHAVREVLFVDAAQCRDALQGRPREVPARCEVPAKVISRLHRRDERADVARRQPQLHEGVSHLLRRQ